MLDDRLGKIHFWGTIIPFNCIFIPLFYRLYVSIKHEQVIWFRIDGKHEWQNLAVCSRAVLRIQIIKVAVGDNQLVLSQLRIDEIKIPRQVFNIVVDENKLFPDAEGFVLLI